MALISCPNCDKQYQFNEQLAGKLARCACGQNFPVPAQVVEAMEPPPLVLAESSCSGCNEPVMPNWKACPACGTKLGAVATAPPSLGSQIDQAPMIQAGDNSVVKANINRGTHSIGSGGPMPSRLTAGQPLIQGGEGSVIKAEVDASTNVHHDNSLKVEGQFVANQTVVHESNVGSVVKLFTGFFSNENEKKIEEEIQALSNDPTQLKAILAQTLRHTLREAKKLFKQQKGLFNFTNSNLGLRNAWALKGSGGVGADNRKRLDLCQKVLDKLHDIGHISNDSRQLVGIDCLDESMIGAEQLLRKLKKSQEWKLAVMLWMGSIGFAWFMAGFANPMVFLFWLLIFLPISIGGICLYQRSQEKIETRLTEIENTVNQMVEELQTPPPSPQLGRRT